MISVIVVALKLSLDCADCLCRIILSQQAARASSNPQRSIPGPNAYNLQSTFLDKYDFNIGVSRVFRLPVAVQLDGPKYKTPAPNQYDVCM